MVLGYVEAFLEIRGLLLSEGLPTAVCPGSRSTRAFAPEPEARQTEAKKASRMRYAYQGSQDKLWQRASNAEMTAAEANCAVAFAAAALPPRAIAAMGLAHHCQAPS